MKYGMKGIPGSVSVDDGTKGRHPNWETSNDRVLLDLMIEEMHKKNYSCRSFKIASWTTIAKLYNAAVGENSTWIQVKERFKSLKRKFELYEELLKLSGWGWDLETQTPIPGYEGAWDEALRVNSRFSTIRRKPFPLYDQMQMLCKNSICTGALAEGLPRAMNGRNAINENFDAEDDDVPIAMNINATAVAAGRAIREAIADQLWAVGNAY
ncbi:hypothetical protein Taro_035335 [Colocasia esculenta]|uniref:Myb/SANT-like domain-containing protein n=1 Tax=Colocasia esculenta TaxID=4460 RepID=A0A843WA93_COLES|nr:hypothetical protein [Colocasia esculenta]